jgi:hypothetical protein
MRQQPVIHNAINLSGTKFNPLSVVAPERKPVRIMERSIDNTQIPLNATGPSNARSQSFMDESKQLVGSPRDGVRVVANQPRKLTPIVEKYTQSPRVDNAYAPGPLSMDRAKIFERNGFVDQITKYKIGTGAGNGYLHSENKVTYDLENGNPHRITSLSNSTLDGVVLPEDTTLGNLNMAAQTTKMENEATRRQTMIDGFRAVLHKKRPPGSITSNPNSRS